MNDQGPELRREVRYQVKGTIEGYIYLAPGDDNIPFKILNVSKTGMCVATARRLPDEPELTLIVHQLKAQVSIAWMIPDSSPNGGFRYGICQLSDDINFVDALQADGLLSENLMRTTTSESEAFVDEFFTASSST